LHAELKTIFLKGKHILLKREWSYGTIIGTTRGISGNFETVELKFDLALLLGNAI
jgi:hypothetical protein